MARKFFNQKVQNTKKTVTQIVIIVVCIIGIIICFFVASYFNNRKPKDAIIELRDSVAIEIGGELPDITTFFSQLENVDEDDIKISFADVDVNQSGEYPIKIKIYNKKYDSKLLIVDTKSPELEVKNVTINTGESYKAEDFVESCKDNSENECTIKFYDLATDQDGNAINYASYKTPGSYKIQISATDNAENETIKDAILTINQGEDTPLPPVPPTTTCKYGSNEYDTKNIMAIEVTENGCAIDLNLYKDQKVLAPVEALMDKETERLKNEFKKLNMNEKVVLNRSTEAILNKEGKGLVGYIVEMELSIVKDDKSEVVEKYFIDKSGKRIYSINKYNLN